MRRKCFGAKHIVLSLDESERLARCVGVQRDRLRAKWQDVELPFIWMVTSLGDAVKPGMIH